MYTSLHLLHRLDHSPKRDESMHKQLYIDLVSLTASLNTVGAKQIPA